MKARQGRANWLIVAMLIPFNYIVTAAIRYGMSTYLAWGLVPILNGARYFFLPLLLYFDTN